MFKMVNLINNFCNEAWDDLEIKFISPSVNIVGHALSFNQCIYGQGLCMTFQTLYRQRWISLFKKWLSNLCCFWRNEYQLTCFFYFYVSNIYIFLCSSLVFYLQRIIIVLITLNWFYQDCQETNMHSID